MLLPSALPCDLRPPLLSSTFSTSHLLSSPPISDDETAGTLSNGIYSTCRALQSLLGAQPKPSTLSKQMRAHRLSAHPAISSTRINTANPNPTAPKYPLPPQQSLKKRRRDIRNEMKEEEDFDTLPDQEDLPKTPTKRVRLAPPSLPLGLSRADFYGLREPLPPSSIPHPHPQPEQSEQPLDADLSDDDGPKEWDSTADTLLVDLILEKLKLTRKDWDHCAKILGKDKASLGRRWKFLVGEGEVGLRSGYRFRRGVGGRGRGRRKGKHSICQQINTNYLPGLLPHRPGAILQFLSGKVEKHKEVLARNRYLNVDGFGIAYYTPSRSHFTEISDPETSHAQHPILYKSAQPPLHDRNFRSLAANTGTLTLFAHIRSATATPVVNVNNHPFAFGRHILMHNGVISDFVDIARDMCAMLNADVHKAITGRTDSEHFAALYMTYLCGEKTPKKAWKLTYPVSQMRDALVKAMVEVMRLQQKVLGYLPPNSMNIAVTDGDRLVAVRMRNHTTEEPPSLYYSQVAGVTMNRKYPGSPNGGVNEAALNNETKHGRHLIVASEPSTDESEWTLIPKNHYVMMDKDGAVSIAMLEYPEELDSTIDVVKGLAGEKDEVYEGW